jgi:hypothetical protein
MEVVTMIEATEVGMIMTVDMNDAEGIHIEKNDPMTISINTHLQTITEDMVTVGINKEDINATATNTIKAVMVAINKIMDILNNTRTKE